MTSSSKLCRWAQIRQCGLADCMHTVESSVRTQGRRREVEVRWSRSQLSPSSDGSTARTSPDGFWEEVSPSHRARRKLTQVFKRCAHACHLGISETMLENTVETSALIKKSTCPISHVNVARKWLYTATQEMTVDESDPRSRFALV
jgi:hypothetical protein